MQTISGTYDAIRYALRGLGDHHSFFVAPGGQSMTQAPLPPAPAPSSASAVEGKRLAEGLGYIAVSEFSGSGAESNALATQYHRLIQATDTSGVCGWVVDLRGNRGGNMWPMVAGIGPLAGTGVLGSFVDPDSVVTTWTYGAGGAALNGTVLAQASDPYTLSTSDPPVAVLTDSLTASSGEATVIAFRGRPDTRSFGRPTWGVSTANLGFSLSDGAMIYLTVSVMADRTGRLYGDKIVPDVDVAGLRTGDPSSDPPLAAAVDWLLAQAACAPSEASR